MVRIKYTLLVKLAAACFFIFVFFPFLGRIFSSPSSKTVKHENEDYRKEVIYDIPHKENRDLADNGEQFDDKENNLDDKNPSMEAVFTEGKLGNYEPKNLEPRSGPGENGEGVSLSKVERPAGLKSVREYGFNMVASGKISMDRRIKDTRHHECKYWSYPETRNLPTASVILVFFNEGFTTLMRTVHSVINTSPKELLKEVILVDDFSTKSDLKEKLEEYIKQFNGLVKLVRTEKREGLIRARVIGAENMSGDVIVILDAHCECVTNWLPPLLTRIAVNRKTVAVPIVESIDWNTYKHNAYGNGGVSSVGIWEWGFLYKEMTISDSDLKAKPRITSPTKSPTHAGGLLAIEKKWFFELGGYDPGILIWGAEQYELSFKTWQCGGQLEWVPCSHVAHIYRGPRTESVHPPQGNPHQNTINHLRLAHTWMDEYKEYYYIREPQIRNLDFGDISAQLEIRERLQCKSFKWYMENVAYDMVKKFPIPPKNKVWGEVINDNNNVCFDTLGSQFGQPIGVGGCHHYGGSQQFRLNVQGELSAGEHCFKSDRNIIKNQFCLNYEGVWKPEGEWEYDEGKKMIKSNKEKKCITTDGRSLSLDECDESNANQHWRFKETFIR